VQKAISVSCEYRVRWKYISICTSYIIYYVVCQSQDSKYLISFRRLLMIRLFWQSNAAGSCPYLGNTSRILRCSVFWKISDLWLCFFTGKCASHVRVYNVKILFPRLICWKQHFLCMFRVGEIEYFLLTFLVCRNVCFPPLASYTLHIPTLIFAAENIFSD